MADLYGTESLQSERYRLSFTVGGLLEQQGKTLAALYVRKDCRVPVSSTVPASSETARFTGSNGKITGDLIIGNEIGSRIQCVRAQALADNVLSIRTQTANSRMISEVLKRLSALTEEELACLAGDSTPSSDRKSLMWVAMCRYYAIVGEFASEVLRDHYLMGIDAVTYEDYDRFIQNKAMWHPELEELSDTTAKKLRANVFRAMREAGLLNGPGDTIVPSLLGGALTDMLENKPGSFEFFPLREANSGR